MPAYFYKNGQKMDGTPTWNWHCAECSVYRHLGAATHRTAKAAAQAHNWAKHDGEDGYPPEVQRWKAPVPF